MWLARAVMLLMGIQAILVFGIGVAGADAGGDYTLLTTEQMASIRGAGTVYKVCNVPLGLGCSSPCASDPISGKWHKTIGNAMYVCGTSTVAPDKPCTNDMHASAAMDSHSTMRPIATAENTTTRCPYAAMPTVARTRTTRGAASGAAQANER